MRGKDWHPPVIAAVVELCLLLLAASHRCLPTWTFVYASTGIRAHLFGTRSPDMSY